MQALNRLIVQSKQDKTLPTLHFTHASIEQIDCSIKTKHCLLYTLHMQAEKKF
jgi:hypothetical protein